MEREVSNIYCQTHLPLNPLDQSLLEWQTPAYLPLLGWWFNWLQCLKMFPRSLPLLSSLPFRSWLFHVYFIEIQSWKISHVSPAEFLGSRIMYNKTVGKVISRHESCNFPAIDFLKITHCLRAVKANLTRKMSLFRTPWLAIVMNSYNYYWLKGGLSFVKMLLKWQSGDGFKQGKWAHHMKLPTSQKKFGSWLIIAISERPPHPPYSLVLTENVHINSSS